jgi:TRAP transporter TAXI family solute receptor
MRRTFLIAIAGGLAFASAAVVVNYFFFRPAALRVAVARDTDDHKLMGAVARVFSATRENVRLRIVPVNTAAASAAALRTGEADLAVVRSDIAVPPNGQTLVILHHNPAFLIARGDSGIAEVPDLKGKKVGIIRGTASGEGNSMLLDVILAQYDLPANAIGHVLLDRGELPESLKDHRIDAIFVVAPSTSEVVTDAVSATAQASGGATFVPIADAKAIAQRLPALESIEIVRGAFGGNPPRPSASFDTLAVSARLMARASLRDSIAADLTRLLFTERLAIAQIAPLANQIEAPPVTKGATLPVHPGAAAYLDDEEKGFFDQYSDFFYIGAMLLSVVGSGLAALASRMTSAQHTELDRLLAQLLQILKFARTAEQPEELDRLEQEIDEILVSGIANRQIHGIDAQGMAAMTLALDQARRAVRERRAQVERIPARLIDAARIASAE